MNGPKQVPWSPNKRAPTDASRLSQQDSCSTRCPQIQGPAEASQLSQHDRLSYENWTGKYELPIHVTKELYLPGDAADPRDAASTFQFPVKDGDWISNAVEANRYIRNRRYKPKINDANTTQPPTANS